MKGRFTLSYVLILCSVLTLQVALPWMVSAEVVEEWVARYNGPGNGTDHAFATAVDSLGNVYVTGESSDIGPNDDYTTIKYDSKGNEKWVARYNGPGNGRDLASAITVDSSGNVYVTGESSVSLIDWDYATVKYDSNGNEKWVARYNGPGNAYDSAFAIAVDSLGNVYVTGYSTGFGSLYDYATVKYDSNGNEEWVARYSGPGEDRALGLAVDSLGNVYVTGYSTGFGTDYDYITVKYNTNGSPQWVKRYNGPGNGRDLANAIAIDSSANVYVTGYSAGIGTDYDYATVKYDASGSPQWVKRYNGPGNSNDHATAIAIDAWGNVYVTGYSTGIGTYYDYATIKYDTNGSPQWVKRYNGPGNNGDGAYAIAIDAWGNVYVTGESRSSGTGLDYATLKYDGDGNRKWIKRYNGPGDNDDSASAMAVDTWGSVYVTGYSTGSGTGLDYATVRYRDQYSVKEVFLISDEVWRDVLSLVPLTTWTDNDGTIHKYPTLIYHREETGFDADSIIYFLQQYSPIHLTIVGETPQELDNLLIAAPQLGAGLEEAQISKITMNDYFSYWPDREVFIVSEDDYEIGLMASVFASYVHAPLLFEGHFDNDVIKFKEVYIIGNLSDQQAIEDIADVLQAYSLADLQKRYIELTNTDKVILVNPGDLDIKLTENFDPELSEPIHELFGKNSLASPFLAAAKHELIIFTHVPVSPFGDWNKISENIEAVDNEVNLNITNLFGPFGYNPDYLTILAMPQAIPERGRPSDSFVSKDWLYGSMDDTNPLDPGNVLMGTGRIYSITISDVSSYVFRSIFYNGLLNERYLPNEYTGLAIGHSFNNYRTNMPKVRENTEAVNYDTPCFIDKDSILCTKCVHPDLSIYNRRQFTVYGDHGSPYGWSGTLSYSETDQIRFDLTYIFAHACATLDFWTGRSSLIGARLIRRGAISYEGAVVNSNNDGLHSSENVALQYLTDSFMIPLKLGDLSKMLKGEFHSYKRHYMLLGDPTLEPFFKEVNWQ